MREVLTLPEFEKACQQPIVEVDSYILNQNTEIRHCYTPAALLRSVMLAARQIRSQPARPLAKSPIDITETIASDSAALGLSNIINDSLESFSDTSVPAIDPSYEYSVHTCKAAELAFANSLRHLGSETGQPEQYGLEIILDPTNDPLLVRKFDGEKSALSVKPIAINGIRYPAGGLFRVDMQHDRSSKSGLVPAVESDKVAVLPFSKVMAARFERLSAFALLPEDRGRFTYQGIGGDYEIANQALERQTLAELQTSLQQATVAAMVE